MATRTRHPRRKQPAQVAAKQLARLEATVARLDSQVRALTTELSRRANREALPALPPPDAEGNYPAAEALDVVVARQIIRRRQAAGWSQMDLARRAGVRQETVSRVESGKHVPNVATVDKLDRALRRAGI